MKSLFAESKTVSELVMQGESMSLMLIPKANILPLNQLLLFWLVTNLMNV